MVKKERSKKQICTCGSESFLQWIELPHGLDYWFFQFLSSNHLVELSLVKEAIEKEKKEVKKRKEKEKKKKRRKGWRMDGWMERKKGRKRRRKKGREGRRKPKDGITSTCFSCERSFLVSGRKLIKQSVSSPKILMIPSEGLRLERLCSRVSTVSCNLAWAIIFMAFSLLSRSFSSSCSIKRGQVRIALNARLRQKRWNLLLFLQGISLGWFKKVNPLHTKSQSESKKTGRENERLESRIVKKWFKEARSPFQK